MKRARKQGEVEAAQQRAEPGHLSRVALGGEMGTSLAHELNQPLAAIVANASAAQRFIARGEMNPDELRELLADITADGRRAGEVIRGIKGMVRKVEDECHALDVNERVFERFFSTKSDGMGMGLSVAHSIIEAHAGTLGVENAEGADARFWFRVPAQVTTPVEAPA